MKKSKASQKRSIPSKQQKLSFLTMATAGLLLAVICVFTPFVYGHYKSRQDISEIRSLILLAAEGTSVPAPIDARSGNAYFPAAKLYLPSTPAFPQLTYTYESSDSSLRVSTKQIYTANASKLYQAQNLTELFNQVPKLQACNRGVLIRPQAASDTSLKYLGKTTVSDNRTLYLYNEKACPELDFLGTQLLGVQSY